MPKGVGLPAGHLKQGIERGLHLAHLHLREILAELVDDREPRFQRDHLAVQCFNAAEIRTVLTRVNDPRRRQECAGEGQILFPIRRAEGQQQRVITLARTDHIIKARGPVISARDQLNAHAGTCGGGGDVINRHARDFGLAEIVGRVMAHPDTDRVVLREP
jgi:hypothetical protein